jgi:type I restriction enzyme S subunit
MARLLEAIMNDVCALVTDGTHDTPKRVESGFPLIKAKEIVGGRIDFSTCDQISEEEHLEVIARSKPEYSDTLFAHIGASLGEAAFVDTTRSFSIKNVALFKPNPTIIDGRYLYYVVISPDFQELAKRCKTGSAQPFLSLGHLRSHRISYHEEIATQRKIASILSAYDALIENNARRITILEAMTEALYREWFVEFRFPGHKKVKVVNSPLGKIPEKWEVMPVGDVIETFGGGTPSTKEPEYWENGTVTWYSPTDLTKAGTMFIGSSEKRISVSGLQNSSAKLFPAYSVMMTSRATIGVVSITSTEACTNQGFITCVPNARLSCHMIYFWLHGQKEKIVSLASGATFKEISRSTFRKLPMLVPPQPLRQAFDEFAAPICKMIESLLKKQAILRTTRDLLLPKLISGQIDVEDLDIDVTEPLVEADT